jgi:hypothetical protein
VAAYAAVARVCRESDRPLVASDERIREDLWRAGLSVATPGRLTTTARLGGQVHRVLKLHRDAVARVLTGVAPPAPSPPDAEGVTEVTGVTAPGTDTERRT